MTLNLDRLYDLSNHIDSSIREDAPLAVNEGGIIKKGYNKELDSLINLSQEGKGWLAKLEAKEKGATGIN